MANASRISASAAVAILRLSVSGWSVMRPKASDTSSSASRTSPLDANADTPSSATIAAARVEPSGGPPTPPSPPTSPPTPRPTPAPASAVAGSIDPRPYDDPGSPGLMYGVVLGLLATCAGLAVARVVVGFVSGAASPVVPVGQEFID